MVAVLTPADLIAAGQKLYGRKKWKTHLSEALGVNVATIHRMVHRPLVPGPYAVAISSLLANKKARDELERQARKLLPKGYKRPHVRAKKKRKYVRKLIPYAGSPELEQE